MDREKRNINMRACPPERAPRDVRDQSLFNQVVTSNHGHLSKDNDRQYLHETLCDMP